MVTYNLQIVVKDLTNIFEFPSYDIKAPMPEDGSLGY